MRLCLALPALSLPAWGETDDDDDLFPPQANLRRVACGNTTFAVSLYGQLRQKEGNLFYSPFSISTALAMTSAGARGKTLEQMEEVLHFPDQKVLHPAVSHLIGQLNDGGGKGKYQLVTANALWGQSGYKFRKDFLDLNKKHYEAGLRLVDFKDQTEASRQTINRWVAEQTKEKIKDLVPKDVVNDRMRLVQTNAIYFQGDWLRKFKEKDTRDEDFHLTADKKVKVRMMTQGGSFGYHETRSVQVLEMPYAGGDLSMVGVLPVKKHGLAEVEKALTADQINDWVGAVKERQVNVHLPKFKVAYELSLKESLKKMGMTLAFSLGADLSGMDGTKELFLQDVVHKAFVDVNEKGTEAAAATAAVVGLKSAGSGTPKVYELRADHPFLFLIREGRSGCVLFMGRVSNPKG